MLQFDWRFLDFSSFQKVGCMQNIGSFSEHCDESCEMLPRQDDAVAHSMVLVSEICAKFASFHIKRMNLLYRQFVQLQRHTILNIWKHDMPHFHSIRPRAHSVAPIYSNTQPSAICIAVLRLPSLHP